MNGAKEVFAMINVPSPPPFELLRIRWLRYQQTVDRTTFALACYALPTSWPPSSHSHVLQQIVQAAELGCEDHVLEVGPGRSGAARAAE
jgi:hypothetical protein